MAKKKKLKPSVDTVWGTLRILLGFIFTWAFVDKLFGLGFATCRDEAGVVSAGCKQAMIHGGSPTMGFLKFGTHGPLADFYQSLAGNAFIDYLFMAALLGIGIALIFGIGMRIATVSGVLLLTMMWSATFQPENNPLIDDHTIYSVLLVGLLMVNGKQQLGYGKQWAQTEVVKRFPILK